MTTKLEPIVNGGEMRPCSKDTSVLEGDLEFSDRQGTLSYVEVREMGDGAVYIVVRFSWSGNNDWYVCSRRARTQPKVFKSLNTVNRRLIDLCPTRGFTLLRDQKLPPAGLSDDQI